MAKWLLTSDWQASRNNLDECMRAQGEVLHLSLQHKVHGVINLGDFKEAYDPVAIDVVNFWVNSNRAIKEKNLELIELLGNHDRISQYSDNRNWFTVFRSTGAHAIETPSYIEYDNVVFACLPFIHDVKKLKASARKLWRKVKKIKHKKRVLLFHCDVKGAEYNNLGIVSDCKVTTQDLLMYKYDRCFGGHIHKRQELANNAMYVGNPFCCDWGEINQEKGYIIYDDAANTWTCVKSRIPGWFSFDYLREHKTKKVLLNTRIKHVLDCNLSEDYTKIVENYRERIAKCYPDAKIYVVPRFESQDHEEVIVDPEHSDYDKIKNYVKATIPSELKSERKKCVEYLISILNKVSETNVRSHGGVTIDKVSAKNVLSYKRLKFDYRKRGVCLVRGENKDWPKHSNGSGKTNFLSMLPVAWFGQTFKKKQRNDDWANERTQNTSTVKLYSHDDKGHRICVIRRRRPSKLKLLINDKDASFGLKNIGQKETQGYIENIVGYSPSSLQNSIYIDSSMPKAFLDGTSKDRAELISRFQNIERFKAARDLVAKDIKKIYQSIATLEEDITIEDSSLQEYIDDLESLKKNHSSSSKAEVKRRYRVCRKVRKEYKSIKKENKAKITLLLKELTELEKEYDSLTNKQIELRLREKALAKELTQFSVLESKCPRCKQKVSSGRRKKLVHTCELSVSEIQSKFKVQQNVVEKLWLAIVHLRNKLAKAEKQISRASDNYEHTVYQLHKAKAVYKESKKLTNRQSKDYEKASARVKAIEAKLTLCKKSIETENNDLLFMQYCVKAFSRDGIPLFLNSLACPLLNQASQLYSKMFTDNEIQVRFDLVEGEIVPQIINVHGSKTLAGQSDGEKAWAGIISSLALRELAPRTNLLIFDEPGFGLDPESAKTLGNKLKLLGDKFETVLVTTHNREIEAALDGENTINITKENNTSKLN